MPGLLGYIASICALLAGSANHIFNLLNWSLVTCILPNAARWLFFTLRPKSDSIPKIANAATGSTPIEFASSTSFLELVLLRISLSIACIRPLINFLVLAEVSLITVLVVLPCFSPIYFSINPNGSSETSVRYCGYW